MTEENLIKENLKDYKFSLSGYLMINLGTQKRTKWFPIDDMRYLEDIARKFYKLGIEEGKKQATNPYQDADEYNRELRRWDMK